MTADERGRRPRRSGGVGSTIGGILVGFDEQVWNRRPPAQEQVARTDRPLRVAVPGGRVIELPGAEADGGERASDLAGADPGSTQPGSRGPTA